MDDRDLAWVREVVDRALAAQAAADAAREERDRAAKAQVAAEDKLRKVVAELAGVLRGRSVVRGDDLLEVNEASGRVHLTPLARVVVLDKPAALIPPAAPPLGWPDPPVGAPPPSAAPAKAPPAKKRQDGPAVERKGGGKFDDSGVPLG